MAPIVALLAIAAEFSAKDESVRASSSREVPVAPNKVERPTPSFEFELLLRPPRRAGRLATAIMIDGHIDLLDATTLRNGPTLIRLRHVERPERDAICCDEVRAPWSCGLQARAALVNAVRSGPVRCLPALDAPGENGVFQCWVGEQDLSRVMVQRGWAKPALL